MSGQQNTGDLLRIGNQLICIDRRCTTEAYSQISTPGSEECGCAMCRNYIAQRSTIYPLSFLTLLQQLGIDAAKAGEVYYLAPNSKGKRLYGGWFFFCGEIIEAGDKQYSQDGVSYFIKGPSDMPSPYPRDRFGPHPLALDFSIEIPWVLSADEDPDPDTQKHSGDKS